MAEELRDTPSRREVSTLEKRLELREVEVGAYTRPLFCST
jgi:hypothetical protein